MSAADLLEDSFPHGTPQGYDRGCRGMRCRGVDDFGWSCSYAKQQYSGDYHWRQWVDAGMSPAEIKIARGAQAPGPVKAKDAAPKLATVPTVSIADSREPVVERPKPRPVPNPAETVRPAPSIAHGTYYGYQQGCRDEESCPSKVDGGMSCREAKRVYEAEWREKRRAKKAEALSAEVVDGEQVETEKAEPQTIAVGTREIGLLIQALPDGAVQITITVPGAA